MPLAILTLIRLRFNWARKSTSGQSPGQPPSAPLPASTATCRNALARVYVNSFGPLRFVPSVCVFWARFGFDKSVLGGVSVLFCSVRFGSLRFIHIHSLLEKIQLCVSVSECVALSF